MSSSCNSDKRLDEPTHRPPGTPIQPSQGIPQPRMRTQNNPLQHDQPTQDPQQAGLQQRVYHAPSPIDANGQNLAQRAQWRTATGSVMSTATGENYPTFLPRMPSDTQRMNFPGGPQFEIHAGSSNPRRSLGLVSSAIDNAASNTASRTAAHLDPHQHRVWALAQQQRPQANFTRSSIQGPTGFVQDTYTSRSVGGTHQPQSDPRLNTPLNIANPFMNGYSGPGSASSHFGYSSEQGSIFESGGAYSGSLYQDTTSQQHLRQGIFDPRSVSGNEVHQMSQLLGQSPHPALLAPQDQAAQGSPLIALQPTITGPNNLNASQPAPPSHQAPYMQEKSSRLPQQGVPGYTRAQTQLPPMDLMNPRLRTSNDAQVYLHKVYWRPFTRNHGVPRTDQERLPYVKRIYDAIIALDNVHDLEPDMTDAKRFWAISGIWGTVPASIEAIAHQVVGICVTLHTRGAMGLALGRQHVQLSRQDKMFTFAQRIYFMSTLLRGFKFVANLVMLSTMTQEYLARIWSTLQERPQFKRWWDALTAEEQIRQFEVLPYHGMPANPPTFAEKTHMINEHKREDAQHRDGMQRLQIQAAQQYRQSAPEHLQQVPTQPTPKRLVNTVEDAEPGPLAKRRKEEEKALSDSSAVREQMQEHQTQQESKDNETSGSLLPPTDNGQQQRSQSPINVYEDEFHSLFTHDTTDETGSGGDQGGSDTPFGEVSSGQSDYVSLFGGDTVEGEDKRGERKAE